MSPVAGVRRRASCFPWSEEARLALLEWCASGTLAELPNQAIWPYVITDGNLQVHNHPGDED
jgi:hypothetical protein